MERHRCKLCHRKFANGRALGGHMRSHMMNLPIPQKPEPRRNDEESDQSLAEETSSSSSSSSDSEEEIEEEDDDILMEKGLLYKLRENPKKSIKLADLEFSPLSSVTLQDRESETESSKNPTRRRSKRQYCRIKPPSLPRPLLSTSSHQHDHKHSFVIAAVATNSSDYNEGEPVSSSISDVTSEEDVAFCLMMLSRDKWTTCHGKDFGDIGNVTEDSNFDTHRVTKKPRGGGSGNGRYKCETCNKVFKSYQALGGHRASHKKIRVAAQANLFCNNNDDNNNNNDGENITNISDSTNKVMVEKKIHECPVCFRVFGSGQALGGHKRSHVIAANGNDGDYSNNNKQQQSNGVAQSSMEIMSEENHHNSNINLIIDLNLPAPVDDEDEISQIAVSAVSDAHL